LILKRFKLQGNIWQERAEAGRFRRARPQHRGKRRERGRAENGRAMAWPSGGVRPNRWWWEASGR